jgi:hypothetical protein
MEGKTTATAVKTVRKCMKRSVDWLLIILLKIETIISEIVMYV